MTWLQKLLRSSIGAKWVMAVTGVLLFLFLIGHLLGNLQLWLGPAAINAYADFLQSKPALVWTVRIGLLVVFVVHVVCGVRLTLENMRARPVGYAREETVQASWASRHMLLTGITTGVFLIYHLLHFTVGAVGGGYEVKIVDPHKLDVYAMMVRGFANPAIALVYISFMVLLYFHLSHGVQSFAQTLGVNHPRFTPAIRRLSVLFALLIAGGNILLVLSCLFGIVQ